MDRVAAELAESLPVLGRTEVGSLVEFEAHVVFPDIAAIGDGDADRFARLQDLLAGDIILPLFDARR
nr:hypothetical protein [Rhizobium sp. SEMIA 4085]